MFADLCGGHCGVRVSSAAVAVGIESRCELDVACSDDAVANSGAWLAGFNASAAEFVELNRRHVDMDVDAVHQRAGDISDVTLE